MAAHRPGCSATAGVIGQHSPGEPLLRKVSRPDQLSIAARRPAGDAVISARQLAADLGLPAPTDEQVAIIQAPLEPALVVAGAGSGKTETMAARVVYLVATGQVRPEQVLGLTFTRKAAAALGQRIRRRLRGVDASDRLRESATTTGADP